MKISYENFKDEVLREMAGRYPEAEVKTEKNQMINGDFSEGLTIVEPGQNISPAIYLDGLYKKYGAILDDETPGTVSLVCKKIAEIYEANKHKEPVDVGFFTDYEKIKGHLIPVLIGQKGNENILRECPHSSFLDLAIILHARFDAGQSEANIRVTNEHAALWGVPENELFETAMENGARDYPPTINGIEQMLRELVGEYEISLPPDSVSIPMMVVSNPGNQYGAAVIAYTGMVKMLAGIYPQGYYMLPSSIHEVFILPCGDGDTNGACLADYTTMVQEVNATQVARDEVLADHAYYYDTIEDRFVY